MEGYLKKWVNLIYHWQSRYFIIHEDSLIYCTSKGSPKKGQVHLSICSIRAVPTDPLRIAINYGMSEMHLRASSVQEKQKWLDALLTTQQRINSIRQSGLLNQRKNNPFQMLNGAPTLDLKRIHQSLTHIWVLQAQLEEKLSVISGQFQTQLSKLIYDIKDQVTQCAQQVDEEYNKLLDISIKLQERIRENNDINPPDHEDIDDEVLYTENFQSFKEYEEDDDFKSINNEIYDERQLCISPTIRSNSQQQQFTRRMSTKQVSQIKQPKPLITLLESIKLQQPIKYNNMANCDAFRDMLLGTEDTRECLPSFKDPNEKMRLFSVIKDMVGKDLSKIAFPITFNEPLSMLQNVCENLEYSHILDQADVLQDSSLRLAYVMVFAVSALAASIGRVKKPFNPIMNETYELQCPQFRFIAEQVSHHPPISVGFADNKHFEFMADTNVKTQFWGKSVEVTPEGWVFVRLKHHDDKISFQRCKSALKNLIMGQQYLDHYGTMNFKNETTREVGQLKLTERGWNGGGAYELSGWVKDKSDKQVCTIKGKWDSSVDVTYNGQTTKVWTRNPLPAQSDQQYYFTQFAIQLNHLNQSMLKHLPPTDCRLRPDQRALENSNVEFAAIEKTRLEQKQRNAKKQHQEQNREQEPKWFKLQSGKYVYSGTYWSARDTSEFHTNGGDIF